MKRRFYHEGWKGNGFQESPSQRNANRSIFLKCVQVRQTISSKMMSRWRLDLLKQMSRSVDQYAQNTGFNSSIAIQNVLSSAARRNAFENFGETYDCLRYRRICFSDPPPAVSAGECGSRRVLCRAPTAVCFRLFIVQIGLYCDLLRGKERRFVYYVINCEFFFLV